jgi:hypothetical protein
MSGSLFLACLALVSGHSWLTLIGSNGLKRGGLTGNDLTNEQYYCPNADLSTCVSPNSSVTLTGQNKRPCMTPDRSPTEASVAAGDGLFLQWAGNGHVGAQSDGTCIYIGITPYAVDPDVSSFQTLSTCTPFKHGLSTDTTISIPSNLAPGEYTVFWYWGFANFYYASCADIQVTAAPSTPSAPPAPKISNDAALLLDYGTVDCSNVSDPDGYCVAAAAPNSYCESWMKDACGKSHCHGKPGTCTNATAP